MRSRLSSYINLSGGILVSIVLVVIAAAAAGAQSGPAVSPAEARKAIEAGYTEWARARVAQDMNTIEKMLAPDFYFQTTDRKRTRQEFIDSVPSLKLTRFDVSVLTVEARGSDWSVVVSEKGEVETKDKEGKTNKVYIELVARDGWRKSNDNQWVLISSEPLSQQRWQDRPPIANW